MKIAVVIVLVLVALLFALGAYFAFTQPRPKKTEDARTEGKDHKPTGFESWLAGWKLPGANASPLKKSTYQAGSPEETVGKADGIRTVKFRLVTPERCDIEIRYIDNAPHDDTLNDQKTHLIRHDDEGKEGDPKETTIVLMKTGGRITFGSCQFHKTGSCPGRIQVVK